MSQKSNRDHAKKTQRPMVEDQVIADHLTSLLTPSIKSQSSFFRDLGLRQRILTLTSDRSQAVCLFSRL